MAMTAEVRAKPAGRRWGALLVWALLSMVPLAAYAAPLWQNALADTPIAYLIWIPVLAVMWGAWNLASIPSRYPDDRELNLLVGGALLLVVGFVAAVGAEKWPVTFVYDHAGLLLWPLWTLGVAWTLFGVGVTPRLLGPLAYLWLSWPQIFTPLVNFTQMLLTGWSIRMIDVLASAVPWVRSAEPAGNFLVQHGTTWMGVVIAQACSGADSLLGAAILLPLLLTFYRGHWWGRVLLVLAALAGALIANWLRLAMLIAALHWIGSAFTFDVLHPVLGAVLFMGLTLGLMGTGSLLGLHLEALPRSIELRVGGTSQFVAAILVSAGLFGALLPVFTIPLGSLANPLGVRTSAVDPLLPSITGFQSSVVYRYNENSVLGPGAYTVARAYNNDKGATAVAEVWSTPNQGRLISYGFDNCLVYHGDAILARESFALKNGIPATIYAVYLPPRSLNGPRALYLDIEWQTALKTPQGLRYVRWSVASFPFPSRDWPNVGVATHPLRGLMALAVPPSEGQWPVRLSDARQHLRPTRD
ncbi:MAG: archaeosortase/exosortase family protein [Clostridia bacterium]